MQVKGKGLINTFFLEKRLQPRDKFLVQNVVEFETPSPAPVEVRRQSVGRRSTVKLQDALKALQSQLGAFSASQRQLSYRSFDTISEDSHEDK